ncbi:MAG: hypothetical protein AVDCRST_MAG93-7594, partial [uncultured Chloroflexia bacterium]
VGNDLSTRFPRKSPPISRGPPITLEPRLPAPSPNQPRPAIRTRYAPVSEKPTSMPWTCMPYF